MDEIPPTKAQGEITANQVMKVNATLEVMDDNTVSQVKGDKATPKVKDDKATLKVKDDKATPKVKGDEATPKVKEDKATSQVKYDKATSQVKEDSATSQVKETKATPQIKDDKEAPEGKDDNETPHVKEDKITPQVKDNNATPKVKDDKTTPQVKYDKATSQVKDDSATPQEKKTKATSQVKETKATPQVKNDSATLQVKNDEETLQVKDDKTTPQVKKDKATPQVKEDSATSEVKETKATPQVKGDKATPQVKETKATPQVKEDSTTPQVKETKATPQVKEDSATPQVKETKANPQVKETKANPQVKETKATPQVKDDKAVNDGKTTSQVKDDKATPKAKDDKATPQVKGDKATPQVKEDSTAPKAKETKATPQVKEDSATPRVKETKATLQVKETKATPQVKDDKAAPQVNDGKATSQVKDDYATPKAKDDKATPQVKGDKATPQLKDDKTTPKVEDVKVTPQTKDDKTTLSAKEASQVKEDDKGTSEVALNNQDNQTASLVQKDEVPTLTKDDVLSTHVQGDHSNDQVKDHKTVDALAVKDGLAPDSVSISINEQMTKVLHGSCPLDNLPPLNKKVVRIFVSSTFSDTKEERNALMEKIYPRLADYCREKFGLEFQVVDMRWGVPEQASDNHSTTELCLQELHKCQEVSVGPNFVAIIGNKYGYRPIPSSISCEEFDTLSSIARDCGDTGWHTITEWYTRDENAQPPVYILQTISSKLKDYNNTQSAELRKAARAEWTRIDRVLTDTLRKISAMAESQGKITSSAKHKYFMSVTENEISHGLLESSTNPSDSCLCIVRKIPDIDQHLHEKIAPKFIDLAGEKKALDEEAGKLLGELRESRVLPKVPKQNLTKLEIEWKASGASISMEKAGEINLDKYANGVDDDAVLKHKAYLDGICEEFYSKIRELIHAGGLQNQQMYDPLTMEILQHQHFARERIEVFEGRDDILGTVRSYLGATTQFPLIIHGLSGCGKTSVMAKIYESMETWTSASINGDNAKNIVRIVRFLGTTPMTSNVQQLLVSMCGQIATVYDRQWEEPDKFSALIKSFTSLLGSASREKPLLILIDSVDQLLPTYNAFNMKWLPHVLPSFVKIVVSTIDEGFPIVDALKERFPDEDTKFLEVRALGDQVGMAVIMKWLDKTHRRITASQQNVILKLLEQCSLPLYARIAFDQISRWRSFDDMNSYHLPATIKGAINKHFEFMENKLGKPLVRHSLAYLTSARFGLSEVELEHILSLDDQLLNQIYQFWKPPIRRIPPLLWTRVRHEINQYVVERSADELLVIQWYHRQFIDSARDRYLQDEDFVGYIHSNLADFFMGKWGGGKEKPFEYTKTQMNRFSLKEPGSSADRKVPSQPYSFTISENGKTLVRFNQRKLSELPYHLLKSKQIDILQKEVFFNYQWLYSKAKCGAQDIIQEMELFMMSDRKLQKSVEMKMLLVTMQLIRPYVSKYPESLALELTGRLAKHIGIHPLITKLISQNDSLGLSQCPLLPLYTCLETADLGLKQNVNIRASEPWHDGGCITCTSSFDTMYIIDYSDLGESQLSSWDIESGELLFEGPILKCKDAEVADEYFQCFLDKNETHLIALYRQRYYMGFHKERYKGNGYIDIISVTDGSVKRTIEEFLYNYKFYNCVLYCTENWLAVRFGWKIPLWNLQEDNKIQLTQPHLLTQDESKFIITKSKKSSVKYHSGDEKVVAETRSKTACVRNFQTKDDLGEFDKSDKMAGIVMLSDESAVLLGDVVGNVNVYEINRLSPGKLLKVKRTLTLPNNEKVKVIEEMKSDEDKQSSRQQLIVSPNDQYVVAVYQGKEHWEAMLWNVTSGKFIARVADRRELRCKYPMFSSDSSVVILGSKNAVQLVSCVDGQVVKTYELTQTIRDFYVSGTSLQMALLLGKEVSFLSTDVEDSNKPSTKLHKKQRQLLQTQYTTTLIHRETVSNCRTYPEILMDPKSATVFEDHGALYSADLDVLNSARSQKRSALDKWMTPDGNMVVELHVRVQVIDTKADDIKYTPHSKDVVLRPVTGANGLVSNEEVAMPSLVSGARILMLKTGDRIVGEGNKVKLRVSDEAKESLQVMTVPSVLSVIAYTSGKPKRIHRVTVYQESVMAVSNKYIVTRKQKASGQYVNVFDLHEGRLMTTHPASKTCRRAAINTNNTKLILLDNELELKTFTGPAFITQELKIDLYNGKPSSCTNLVPKDILDFPAYPQILVIKLTEEGMHSNLDSTYLHVDCDTRSVSTPITVKLALEDVSSDGQLGIDASLNLYDLSKGKIIQRIPYTQASINMQLQVRLLGSNLVCLVDKHDDSLHVLKLDKDSVHPLLTCNTHAPLMPSSGGLVPRRGGHVITTFLDTSTIRGLFRVLVKDSEPLQINYESELSRALSLVPEMSQPGPDDTTHARTLLRTSLKPLPMLRKM